MARRIRDARLETHTVRLLPIAKKTGGVPFEETD
jgi:hypothetical protein